MLKQHHYIIAYDISDDVEREKCAAYLRDTLKASHAQKSVWLLSSDETPVDLESSISVSFTKGEDDRLLVAELKHVPTQENMLKEGAQWIDDLRMIFAKNGGESFL